ncbi:hypothetical protein NB564_12355 [Vibrio parahaemolyticus]|uniref:hypothetical protein n=1 Tax=Vibrio parahaemolyticus TaxID=670 RepID=UPI00215C0857|nr:hypothetical protein [Vibrio parahaemolyticus]MCR9951678.1 hypothetical protein [Vibrio parahaemolyticus]
MTKIKKLVYVLDRDFEHDDLFENEDYTIKTFNRRSLLKAEIITEAPDLVMLDLFTKRKYSQKKIELDLSQELKPSLERDVSIDEKTLGLLQTTKELCRSVLDATHYVSGIKDLIWLTSREDLQITFPIAIFSRHGKSLLTSEDILEISSFGAYLTWKDKDNVSEASFSEREIESIESVIDLYKNQVEQLPLRLTKLQDEINQREKRQEKYYKRHRAFEWLFLIFVVLTALSNLGGVIDPTLVKYSGHLVTYLYPKVFSVLAIATVIAYSISKYVIKSNNKELLSIYNEINGLMHELITQKNKS